MVLKAVLLCICAVLGQSIAGSCYRKTVPSSCGCGSNRVSTTVLEDSSPVYTSEGIAVSEFQSDYKPINAPVISENGGTFTVTSVGRIAPAGIAVASDLGLSGQLEVAGEIPYLSAVAFEGQFDTNGSSAVSYGCGDGCIAITEEIGSDGPAYGPTYGPTYGISSLGGGGCKY